MEIIRSFRIVFVAETRTPLMNNPIKESPERIFLFQVIDQTGHVGGAETIVDIDDSQSRGT